MSWILRLKNIFIIIFGILGFITGTIVSIKQIVIDLSGGGQENDVCSGGAPNVTTTAAPFYDTTTPSLSPWNLTTAGYTTGAGTTTLWNTTASDFNTTIL